ncbi:unnamed protein product [Lactuca saligna]|uniref:Uncharacterized protein n=1 Tax=Lactuca saligna TaxID=75948 RepID=A0AA35ZAX4_LACSI|nr:unnamed protein product [Lactuca saligna]
MDYFLKAQESRLRNFFEGVEHKQAERSSIHSKSFGHEIQRLDNVAKEHNKLFIEILNAMNESLHLKVDEIYSWISKEVKKLEESYKLLHGKVDVIVGVITHLPSKVPQTMAKAKLNINEFVDGEIIHQPYVLCPKERTIEGI